MGSNTGKSIDRTALEKQWAAHAARLSLNETDRALFEASRHTFRPYVYFDKILIAWDYLQGGPQVREVLKVVSVDASFQDGVWVTVYADIAKRELRFSHVPRRVLDLDVFVWAPFFNELRFASADWEDPGAKKNLRLCMCVKTRSSPEQHLVEGQTYISEMHVFRDMWPQYSRTRF